MTHPINTNKLVALAILGFCAVVLGGAVLSLQLQVMQQRQLLGYSPTKRHTRATPSKSSSSSAAATTSRTSSAATNTATYSPYNGYSSSSSQNQEANNVPPPLSSDDIFLHKSFPPPDSTSWKSIGEAYWQRVVPFLQWDILAPPPVVPSPSSSRYSRSFPDPRVALRQAADAGHPAAQHLMANALASGIWPVGTTGLPQQLDDNRNVSDELHVLEDWSSQESPYYHHDDHGDPGFVARQHQMTQAMLYWRMAAIGGNIESAMAIAYRLNATMALSHSTLTDEDICQRTLPYYEAAANGVMDLLEASENSRAKIRPTMDRHSLATVHMHGESSASLGADNKPVESKEAIQYYHMTVAAMPHFSKVEERLYHRKSQSTTTTTTGGNEPWSLQHLVDISKSETVAKEIKAGIKSARPIIPLYYHGKNGVDQNLTQALVYFETLAIHNVWDAAGKAGMFHLWGIGVPQNLNDALTFFQLGAPDTVEGCYHRRTKAQFRKRTNNDAPEVHECDDEALNGMGLLYLMGVPGRLPVDLVKAEKYFLLAKEMKNADAAYNLAMMWLGWKTHFKRLDDLKDHGTSEDSSLDPAAMFPGEDQLASVGGGGATGSEKSSATYALHYSKRSLTDKFYKGPTKSEVNDAMTLLAFAFNRGHLQAQHRLGLIYSEGVTIQTAALRYDAVKPSCKTARHIFEAIAYHVNPILSDRLRKAYNDYNAGDWESSLRNYLAAAETGSNIGQMNAAFLLERGVCLGLSPTDCAKASVRLWKAAAAWGDAEAFLHVGDIYYYGRLRESSLPGSPFPWVQYFIYPEQYLPALIQRWGRSLFGFLAQSSAFDDSSSKQNTQDPHHDQLSMHSDLTMAAHYYADAVSKFESPRANFNLGFMYEWGLGLKQDFPLAKRHYDLASSRSETGEADLAVQIALAGMSTHEFFIKLQMAWENWGKPKEKKSQHNQVNHDGKPLATIASGRTYGSILMDHMFDSSSLLIFVLTVAVFQLNAIRQQRQIERMM